MSEKPRKRKNQIQQIAQQVSETNKNLTERQQQADQARRSPPPMMGADDPLRLLFVPQMR